MRKQSLYNKKYIKVGLFLLLLLTLGFIFSQSYAYFTKQYTITGVNIKVSNLNYELTSSKLNSDGSITVDANSQTEVSIGIKSLNKMMTKYELYYTLETPSSIKIEYWSLPSNDLVASTIDSQEVKTIRLRITNDNSDNVTINFKVAGATLKQSFVFLENDYRITDDIQEVKLTYQGDNPTNYLNSEVNDTFTFNTFNKIQNDVFTFARFYTEGINVGDIFQISFNYSYSNIVLVDADNYYNAVQSIGNIHGYNYEFQRYNFGKFSGTGEGVAKYNITLNSTQLENDYFTFNMRFDYVESGTFKISNFKIEKVYNVTQVKNYNEKILEFPTTPDDRSYTFNGWYSQDGREKITTDTLVPEFDTTYYGQWDKIPRTITINPNGGSFNSSASNTSITTYDNIYTFLSNPTKEGATFAGYEVNGNGQFEDKTNINFYHSGYTMTEKSDNDGDYLNFSYSGDNEFSTDTWFWLSYPPHEYSSKQTYKLTFQVRINKLTGTGLHFRYSAFNNEYNTPTCMNVPIHPETARIGQWQTITMVRIFGSGTMTQGTFEYAIEPRFEMYTTHNLINRKIEMDFDIKNLVIKSLVTDKIVQASNPTYYTNFSDSILTATWN